MWIGLSALLGATLTGPAPCMTGTWVLRASEQAVFRFEITNTPTAMTATWERPLSYEFDGERFSEIRGPMVRRLATSVRLIGGDLEADFDDPTPGATPDIFRLHCGRQGHLDATYQGTTFEAFDLVKAQAAAPPLGPWDAKRNYVRIIDRPTSPEMTAIFNADQNDRQAAHIDWSVVEPNDRKRRSRTQQLLDAGALASGDDFYHAAFVFQHGGVADDYLKAHLLAMIAAARGNPGAVWIASATLDRYLLAIGRPQVLGTQYKLPNGGPASQEPYDRSLASDALRKALLVPSISEQEKRRQQYTDDAAKPKSR